MKYRRKRKLGRFAVAGLLATAGATSLGLLAQRWMTYQLLDVDGGVASWCLAAALLAVMGWTTALLVGVPSYLLTSRLAVGGTTRAFAFCVLASFITTIAHRSLAPFARTVFDHAVIPVLCLVFFGLFYVFCYRGTEQPKKPRLGLQPPSGGHASGEGGSIGNSAHR